MHDHCVKHWNSLTRQTTEVGYFLLLLPGLLMYVKSTVAVKVPGACDDFTEPSSSHYLDFPLQSVHYSLCISFALVSKGPPLRTLLQLIANC